VFTQLAVEDESAKVQNCQRVKCKKLLLTMSRCFSTR